MLVAQNSLGPVCPVPLTVRGIERCVVLDDVREARRGIEAGVLERVRIAKF